MIYKVNVEYRQLLEIDKNYKSELCDLGHDIKILKELNSTLSHCSLSKQELGYITIRNVDKINILKSKLENLKPVQAIIGNKLEELKPMICEECDGKSETYYNRLEDCYKCKGAGIK